MKKKLVVGTSIGIVLVIGALVATLVLTSTLKVGASSNTATAFNGSGRVHTNPPPNCSAATPPPFVPGNQPGHSQLTPRKFAAPVFTNRSNRPPCVLNNAAQFRPGPPPALTREAYAQAIN